MIILVQASLIFLQNYCWKSTQGPRAICTKILESFAIQVASCGIMLKDVSFVQSIIQSYDIKLLKFS